MELLPILCIRPRKTFVVVARNNRKKKITYAYRKVLFPDNILALYIIM